MTVSFPRQVIATAKTGLAMARSHIYRPDDPMKSPESHSVDAFVLAPVHVIHWGSYLGGTTSAVCGAVPV